MLSRLFHSRRFWISVLAVAVNGAQASLPPAAAPAIAAFNLFALALITAYTVEDSARGFGQGTGMDTH